MHKLTSIHDNFLTHVVLLRKLRMHWEYISQDWLSMTGKLSKEENEFQNECFFVFCFPIRKKQDLWLFFK